MLIFLLAFLIRLRLANVARAVSATGLVSPAVEVRVASATGRVSPAVEVPVRSLGRAPDRRGNQIDPEAVATPNFQRLTPTPLDPET